MKKEAGSEPRVLIDCDGVLANFVSAIGLKEHPESWDIFSDGLSWAAVNTIVCQEDFCYKINPYDGAYSFLKSFKDPYIVTSPWSSSTYWMHERYRWLTRKMGVVKERIVITSAKHLCKGDYLIDDYYENIISWCEEWPESTGILFGKYDMNITLPDNAVRLHTYEEVIKYVDETWK